MRRLHIHVEGQTEEEFVKDVLSGHLAQKGFHSVTARLIGNARHRASRGGIKSWQSAKKEIGNHLKSDSGCVVSTMVDYYALPSSGTNAWPGRAESAGLNHQATATQLEKALLEDVQIDLGDSFNPLRFVPFVLMHEFEALLFSDCGAFSRGIFRPDLEPKLQEIRNQFDTPEEINDSPQTAPSKRIENLAFGYNKPFHGILAVHEIGLVRIREECPHFNSWITKLELMGEKFLTRSA